ncbi:hypothetical protein P152DRAFT_406256 [Eremomyces bilateralis CBS 781.70]|uniref:Uncharacterized protein n=1 Tax=Eremomyces bilateralis CBS 781.70 TaxID=1392243 RepID=A0A6G1FQB9_9PEZI|nr:uncharacterized protein P152DRAFT_406256 [Eremomyces bilateralis CBS 781.70]KAF1808025.1 hypothetical protein P152DRAFT_406256 [Eremomyces bilateralis CBS 781.70]
MSQPSEERVRHALSQLLTRIIPVYPDEDEAVADERLEEALEWAGETIARSSDGSLPPDVNHAADLIKKKLIRENNTPEKALRFANLYSRLLTQRVLNQKWAMLYFLFKLGNDPQPPAHLRPANTLHESERSPSPVQSSSPESPNTPPGRQRSERQHPGRQPLERQPLERPPERQLPERQAPERQPPERQPSDEQSDPQDGRAVTRLDRDPIEPSECVLLRDLPFTLQGLSSTNLQFATAPNSVLKLPRTLPVPIIALLHTLAEPSLLYRTLSAFIESAEGGLVGQSFRSALSIELRSYLSLVAALEGQIKRALKTLEGSVSQDAIGKAGVSLKRCVVWTREATMGLRLMSVMVEKSRGKKGGELISLVHSYSLSHGDPFVSSFAERMLGHITKPFYNMLKLWIYDGELNDPYLEFFVSEQSGVEFNDSTADRKPGATSVWEEKYIVNERMVPSIVSNDFANKVFLIGKSLNFIRYGCLDSSWVETYSKTSSRDLGYGDTANLEASIGEAYKTTMARLTHLMITKFHLLTHLQALKKYILLGAGDFIAILMESLAPNLDRPANSQYRHTLTAQLEHAVRSSNAQYEPADVLRRLDSRMLELSHGEIGWDVFTLEYKIDSPVDVIVTPFGAKQYLKVFNFLWRVKRVEFALGSTWHRCMTGARGVLGAVSDKLGGDWKRVRCTVAEMIHFVNQLQYYILFEVIESSWNELQSALSKPESTLDDLIEAHAKYLTAITRKGLLGSSGASTDFTAQLHELFKIMLAYKDAMDGLYSFSVAEFTRRQERNSRIETRTASGKWGLSEKDTQDDTSAGSKRRAHRAERSTDSPIPTLLGLNGLGSTSEDDLLPALRSRLSSLAGDFRVRVNVLLGDLLHQPDADMRWLAMVMNFNDVYQPVRRRKRNVERGKEREGRGAGRERERVHVETPAVGGAT